MKKLAVVFVCLLLAITCQAKIIYVDADANGISDGSSWVNACKYLQDALADANSAEKPVEIRVAEGIYKPDQGAHQTPGSPTATFQLINGVAIKGGYAGFGATDPNARDIALHQTILSGDIGRPSDKSDNCYHIFYHPAGLNLDDTAILDGFTITSGNANSYSWPHYYGGGMYNDDYSSPTVTNCSFSGNSARYRGGGMYNYDNSSPAVTNCTFSDNSATYYGGGMCNEYYSSPTVEGCTFSGNSANEGGGMSNENSSPTVEGCTFTDNSATYLGGGMSNKYYSSPTITNCTFSGNSSKYDGGGMDNDYSSPRVTNCTFTSNSARGRGGGIYNFDNSGPAVTNCTFTDNSANSRGGGICNYSYSSPAVTNCTFTDNSANSCGGGMCNDSYSSPTVEGCTFSGNSANEGGGMHNDDSSPTVEGCTFSGNSANEGGGMYNIGNSSRPTLTNCTIADNSAPNGPAVACDFYRWPHPGSITMVNCIVWNGSNWLWNNDGSTINITYSDVQGGWPGTGNINADPCFAGPGYWADKNNINVKVEPNDPNAIWVDGDYHLKSQAGRWDATDGRWTKDDVTSLCIDAGDPSSPIGLEPFSNGGIINMGVYGGTAEASKSYFGKPPCETIVAGDINGDCKVNFIDFAFMALHWLEDNTPQPPGQASSPWPHDGALSVYLDVVLSWTAGTNALSHDVYFGTDANALASADRMAPEYNGNRTLTKFFPELLNRYTTYYWRIDEICSGGITKGVVWRFITGDRPGPKGMTCFPSDTPVWINGTLVQISKVTAGQTVGKFDCLEETVSLKQIESVQEHEGTFECLDITLENGNTISVVDSHCFLLDSGQWAPVQKLTPGTRLKSQDGLVGIKSIVKREKPFIGKVYNLRTKGTDWYLVGRDGLIVRDY